MVVNHKIRNLKKYNETILCRKLKWYGYINRQRTEDNMIKQVKKNYGGDTTMIMGDWSEKCGGSPSRLRYMSTPTVKLKRKIKRNNFIRCVSYRRVSYIMFARPYKRGRRKV